MTFARRLWVVEMLCGRKWSATVGVRLTRADGMEELRDWRTNNPCDKFRLASYAPVSAK